MEERFQTPDGWKEDYFTNQRGQKIRYGYVLPDNAKALIVISAGLSEFCEKYFEVIREITDKGFAVSVHDWMGQGLSGRFLDNPHKRHIDSFQGDVDDYFDLMDNHILPLVNDKYGKELPRIMLSHSMGGHLGILSILRRSEHIDGAFFSSPLTNIKAVSILPESIRATLLEKVNARYSEKSMPGGGDWKPRTPYGKTIFTHDPIRDAVFDQWCVKNEDLKVGEPTIGWIYEANKSCKSLNHTNIDSIKIPMHAMLAGKDMLVHNKSTIKFFDRIPTASTQMVKGAFHELMMETDDKRNQFFNQFYKFVSSILEKK